DEPLTRWFVRTAKPRESQRVGAKEIELILFFELVPVDLIKRSENAAQQVRVGFPFLVMKLIAAARARQGDKRRNRRARVLLIERLFAPQRWVLPFESNTGSETKRPVLVTQVRPGFLDCLRVTL